jgi:protocatechuate 3,4-dioxygenase, beta subunit
MKTTKITSAVALALLVLPGVASAQAPQSNTGAGASTSLTLTPRQPEGPYYPTQKLADRDNDLTRVGNGVPAQGQVLVLSGRLVDERNTPIPSARIEVWQTDHRGIYMHPDDSGTANRDRNFQFYGEASTDDEGRFSFRTILPGVYGSRPRHLHVKIVPQQGPGLTTQLYFRGDERLSSDGIVRRLGSNIAALLLDPEQRSANELHAQIAFVLRRN